jgi:hypothetical protein
MKLLYIILIVCLLFVMSMINGKAIYDPFAVVDCKVGNYTFSVKKTNCRTTLEYKLNPYNWR